MEILQILVVVCAAISVLVSFLTQVTKGVGILDRVPTKLQALVTSYAITIPALVWLVTILGCTMQWYTWFCLIIAAPLVVTKCSTDGYDWLFDLYERYKG